jgi:hypothetical protein
MLAVGYPFGCSGNQEDKSMQAVLKQDNLAVIMQRFDGYAALDGGFA